MSQAYASPDESGAGPGVPTAGYRVPDRYVVAARMPEVDPFVVRPSRLRLAALFVFIGACTTVPTLFNTFVVPGLVGEEPSPRAVRYAAAGLVAVAVVAFTVNWYLMATRGPLLAIGPAGLWLRRGKTTAKSIWLPWEQIERIYLRRWMFDKHLCVQPRQPRAGAGAGPVAAADQAIQRLLLGTRLSATVVFSDMREPEIVAALTRYSAGRCRIG